MDHANAMLESQDSQVKNLNTHHLYSIRNNSLMTISISDTLFVKKNHTFGFKDEALETTIDSNSPTESHRSSNLAAGR